MGVNQSHEGDAHRAGDHQSRAHDRQHRPARHRRQFGHRPVQRDGLARVWQHHEPARRARCEQRRLSRQSGAACSASTRASSRGSRRWRTTRSSRRSTRARSKASGSSRPTPRTPGCSRRSSARFSTSSISSSCRIMYTTTETAQRADLVLPAAGWGEKEGTFINSERRIGLLKKVVARARPGACRISTSSSSSRTTGAAAKCSRAGPRRRPRFRLLTAGLARHAVRHLGHRGLRADRSRGRHPVAAARRTRTLAQERRLFEDGAFLHRTTRREVHLRGTASGARADRRGVSRSCC